MMTRMMKTVRRGEGLEGDIAGLVHVSETEIIKLHAGASPSELGSKQLEVTEVTKAMS